MEQATYFITEVDDSDEKRNISNVNDRSVSLQRRRKRRKTLKVTNVEKRILAKLVEHEPVLWDKTNEFHNNNNALMAAWSKLAKEMPGRSVPELKTIWRSLKDAVRYRKNKIAKTADGTDEPRDEFEEYEMDYNWEFSDCMSFLMNASSSLAKRSRRMELESSQSPMLRISSVNSASNTTAIDTNISIDCNDDMSVSESSCSYTAQKKEQDANDPLLVESLISMANSIKELVKGSTEERPEKSGLKFDYIWQNLDKLFQKLPADDVDELNVKFMQMAYEKIPRVKHD